MEVAVPRRVLRLREHVVVEADRLNALQHYDRVSRLLYRPYNGLPWDIVGGRTVTSVLECSHCSAVSIINITSFSFFVKRQLFMLPFILVLLGSLFCLFLRFPGDGGRGLSLRGSVRRKRWRHFLCNAARDVF